MAKQIEFGKFLIIECTARELMNATGSVVCNCDWCANTMLPYEKGYYISVLNQWYCEDCFNEWKETATWYPEDARIERKNFEFYGPRLGINVSKC